MQFLCVILKRAFVSISLSSIFVLAADSGHSQVRNNYETVCAGQLDTEVRKITDIPQLKPARLGVVVATLASQAKQSEVLVNLDGDRYFIPASNAKLLTTAAALQTLGANYRIRTELVAQQLPNAEGEVGGGLGVVGRGDPSFTSDTLKLLVQQLVGKGVKRIRGGIYALPQLRGSGLGMGWEWQDLQEAYGAIASSLTINSNSLDWTIRSGSQVGQPVKFSWDQPELALGWTIENRAVTTAAQGNYALQVERSLSARHLIITGEMPQNAEPELGASAIPDPEAYFLDLARMELMRQGIAVEQKQKSATDTSLSRMVTLASVDSPPLAELVKTMNKDSNNLYAELLLRLLGTPHTPLTTPSDQLGIQTITKFLAKTGITSDRLLIADGSGLSRHNLITPMVIVKLLQFMANNSVFRDSLAIAGVDGTLANRFQNPLTQGNLIAKTGTISGVAALSGYVIPANYAQLAFSIMINNGNQPNKELRTYVDAIANLLTRVRRC